jgi:hypothetical protein
MDEKTVTKVIGIAGALLVVGFFLRWFGSNGPLFSPSGLDVAKDAGLLDKLALFAIPIGGALMIWGATKSPIAARRFAFFTGIFILGYFIFTIARIVLEAFQHVAGVGLWLVGIGTVVALFLPLVVKQKA